MPDAGPILERGYRHADMRPALRYLAMVEGRAGAWSCGHAPPVVYLVTHATNSLPRPAHLLSGGITTRFSDFSRQAGGSRTPAPRHDRTTANCPRQSRCAGAFCLRRSARRPCFALCIRQLSHRWAAFMGQATVVSGLTHR